MSRGLAAAVMACLLALSVVAAAQPADDRPLSLDDLDRLDALLEEDTAERGFTLDRGALTDIAGLVVVLGLAFVSFFKKSERLKIATLVVVVGYLGFYKASLVSIVDVFGAIQWSLPVFSIAVAYYLLIGFTVVSTVLWGRLYCGRICAFGALTQLIDKIVPSRYQVELPPWLERRAVYVKYGILGVAILYVVGTGDTLVYRYIEPFWMFTLSGNAIMWTLLAALLLATIFVRNLYCRYLCAVGAGLGLLSFLTVFRIKRWQECQTCRICEKACEWGAIDGPRILVTECVRCDDCERLYADEAKCPHWLILKRSAARSN